MAVRSLDFDQLDNVIALSGRRANGQFEGRTTVSLCSGLTLVLKRNVNGSERTTHLIEHLIISKESNRSSPTSKM